MGVGARPQGRLIAGRTGGTVSTEGRPSGAGLRWGSWPLQGAVWAHARVRTALRRVGLVVTGLGTLLREAAAGVLFVSLWMVTFGLMWGMVAVLLGALIEQVAEMLPPENGIEVEPTTRRLALGGVPLSPIRSAGSFCGFWRCGVLRRGPPWARWSRARSASGGSAGGPPAADRTTEGAVAAGSQRRPRCPDAARRGRVRRRAANSGWRRRREWWRTPRAASAPAAPPPLPVPRTRSAGWAFGPPIELPEGPLFTIEPFLGYRRWVVRPSSVVGGSSGEPVLGSAIVDHLWLEPEVVARCWPGRRSRFDPLTPTTHTAPSLDCRCGIYALRDPRGVDWPLDAALCVEGAVELSGTVLEGERGFRAQRARIVGPLEVANRVRARFEAEGGARALPRASEGRRHQVGSVRAGMRAARRDPSGGEWGASRASDAARDGGGKAGGEISGAGDRRRRQLGMDIGPIKRVWEVEPVEAPAEPARVEPEPVGAGTERA